MLVTKIRTTLDFAKKSMGTDNNYFYVPKFAWDNPKRQSVTVYADTKLTQVVPAEYMKFHFEELYTFEINDKGEVVGGRTAQATHDKAVTESGQFMLEFQKAPTVSDGIDKIIEGLQIIKQAL